MSNLEQSEQPQLPSVTELEQQENALRAITARRQLQVTRSGEKANEYTQQAETLRQQLALAESRARRYRELSSAANGQFETDQARLEQVERVHRQTRGTAIEIAGSIRVELAQKKNELRIAEEKLTQDAILPGYVEALRRRVQQLEDLITNNTTVQEGLQLLTQIEQAQAAQITAEQVRELPALPAAAAEPSPAARPSREARLGQPLQLIRDGSRGIYVIGNHDIHITSDTARNIILSKLPPNPSRDPAIGLTNQELMRILEAAELSPTTYANVIFQINKTFRDELGLDKFTLVVGNGERGKLRYSLAAEVFTPEEWAARQNGQKIAEPKTAGTARAVAARPAAEKIPTQPQPEVVNPELVVTPREIFVFVNSAKKHDIYHHSYIVNGIGFHSDKIKQHPSVSLPAAEEDRLREMAVVFDKIGKILLSKSELRERLMGQQEAEVKALLEWLIKDVKDFTDFYTYCFIDLRMRNFIDVSLRTQLELNYGQIKSVLKRATGTEAADSSQPPKKK